MENGKLLSCGHVFHLHCIKEWVATNTICPTCKCNLIENKDETKKINQQRIRHLEEERHNQHANSVMNKKMNETTGLPFIPTSKIVSNYLNIKKIADIKRVFRESTNRGHGQKDLSSKMERLEEKNCNINKYYM